MMNKEQKWQGNRHHKENIVKFFKESGFTFEVKMNFKVVDYLDVTFNIQ